MRFILKTMGTMAVVGVAALVGYAIFSELPAPQREIALPIEPR